MYAQISVKLDKLVVVLAIVYRGLGPSWAWPGGLLFSQHQTYGNFDGFLGLLILNGFPLFTMRNSI